MPPTIRQKYFSIMASTLSRNPLLPMPDPAFIQEFYSSMERECGQTPFFASHVEVTDEMLQHWIPKLVDILNDALFIGDVEHMKQVIEAFIGVGDIGEFYNYNKTARGWNSSKQEANEAVFKEMLLYVLEEVIRADPKQQLMCWWNMVPTAILNLIRRYLCKLYPDLLFKSQAHKPILEFPSVQLAAPPIVKPPATLPAAEQKKMVTFSNVVVEIPERVEDHLSHRSASPSDMNQQLPDSFRDEVPESHNQGGLDYHRDFIDFQLSFPDYQDEAQDIGSDSEDDVASGLSLDLHTDYSRNTMRSDNIKLEQFVLPPIPTMNNNLKRPRSDDWIEEITPTKLKSPMATSTPVKQMHLERMKQMQEINSRRLKVKLGLYIDPALGRFDDLPIEEQYCFVKERGIRSSSSKCHTMIYFVSDKDWPLDKDLPVGTKIMIVVFDENLNGRVRKVRGYKAPDPVVVEALRGMVDEMNRRRKLVRKREEYMEEEEIITGTVKIPCVDIPKKRKKKHFSMKTIKQECDYDQDLELKMIKEEKEEKCITSAWKSEEAVSCKVKIPIVDAPKKTVFDMNLVKEERCSKGLEKNITIKKEIIPFWVKNSTVDTSTKISTYNLKNLITDMPTKSHFDMSSIKKEFYTQVRLGLYVDPALGCFTDLPIQENFCFARTNTVYPPTRSCSSMIYFVKDKDALQGQLLPERISMLMIVFDEEMKAQVRRIRRHKAPEPVVVDALRSMVDEMNRRIVREQKMYKKKQKIVVKIEE